MPLKLTTLLAGVVLKFVPERITVAPTEPVVGEKLVNVGVGNTVKFEKLVTVTPLVVTAIGPVIAPGGTVTVMDVGDAAETTAGTPLKNCTVGLAPKFVPVRITVAPTAPLAGEKEASVGVGNTVKFVALATVTPLVVTEIGPVEDPAGTAVVSELDEATETLASVPLK